MFQLLNRHLLAALFCGLFFCSKVNAQPVSIFEENINAVFQLEKEIATNNNIKYLFQKISEGNNNKPLNDITAQYAYTIKKQITKKYQEIEISVQITNEKITGDTLYRGFSISQLFKPETLNYTIVWMYGNKKQKEIISKMQLPESETFDIFRYTDTVAETGVTQQLNSDIKLVFDTRNKLKAEYRVNEINKYYSKVSKVDSLIDKLLKIQIASTQTENKLWTDNVIQYFNEATKAEELYLAIKQDNFYLLEVVRGNDPENLEKKTNELSVLSKGIKILTTKTIQKLHEIYFQDAQTALLNTDTLAAIENLKKSLNQNPVFFESNILLSEIYFNQKLIEQATSPAIIAHENSNLQTKNQKAKAHLQKIFDYHINQALQYNTSEDFDLATVETLKAENICAYLKNTHCPAKIKQINDGAIQGIYQRFLKQADAAITNNKLLEAETILTTARNYLSDYTLNLSDFAPINQRLIRIYFDYISNADMDNSIGNYKVANINYNNAVRFTRNYPFIPHISELEAGINTANSGIYNELITKAQALYYSGNTTEAEQQFELAKQFQIKNKLEPNADAEKNLLTIKQTAYINNLREANQQQYRNNYQPALDNYLLAYNLERNYPIERDTSLRTNIQKAALKLIDEYLKMATSELEVNNVNGAKEFYNKAILAQAQYGLLNNKATIHKLNDFNSNLFGEECKEIEDDYMLKIQKAITFMNRSEYIYADRALNSAIYLCQNQSVCNIDAQQATKLKDSIKLAVEYQYLLLKFADLSDTTQYTQALVQYETARQFHNTNKLLEKYNIQHKSQFDYFNSNKFDNFIIFGVIYYTELNETENALELLKTLFNKGIDKKITKHAQQKLGVKLAEKDNQNPVELTIIKQLTLYTNNNAWYSYLKTAYQNARIIK